MSWLRDTITHLRPRSFPIVLTHYACGAFALYGQWKDAPPVTWLHVILGGVLWTVFLNGGTLAINSAYDRDEGDIGYLDRPPPIPNGLALVAALLMGTGMILSGILMPRLFVYAYLACFALSILYSVPPIRLKAIAGADLIVNMIGYGALTFAAGGLATSLQAGVPLIVLTLLAASFAFLFGAFYPMTQIYQIPEDSARGDRTLAVRFGARNSLLFSAAAVFGFAACQIAAAIYARVTVPGFVVLALVAAAWFAFTLHWLARLGNYPEQKGMYRALKLWAVADLATVGVFLLFARW
jgi:lycopene elongase/hydratase (dihydrobisanhydrobacterioruberin-forming)